MNDEKIIKRKYGEKFWHYCKSNFGVILKTPGVLNKLLQKIIAPTNDIYDILDEKSQLGRLKSYVLSKYSMEKKEEIDVLETPTKLLEKVGYDLFECKSEEDIQSFKKYYADGEELCTFDDNRLETNFVFFAVKKNVDEIKREDFKNPERQNLYGTSVISIQFTKDEFMFLSIKNRYNHIVKNCDSTFDNNLDNIVPGLTKSFADSYALKESRISRNMIRGFVRTNDDRLYCKRTVINNIIYSDNNIIINDKNVIRDYTDTNRYLLFNHYILDLHEKKIFMYDNTIQDSFPDVEKDIRKIEIINEDKNKRIILYHNTYQSELLLDSGNSIISYKNNNVTSLDFIFNTNVIKELELNNLVSYNDDFIFTKLENCDGLPNLKYVHGSMKVDSLKSVSGLSNLESIEGDAVFKKLKESYGLEKLSSIRGDAIFPSLESATGLSSLTCMGGSGDFRSLKFSKGLDNLEVIGWVAQFTSLIDASNLNKLKMIGSVADFSSLEDSKGLEKLEYVGSALFNKLKSAKSLKNLNRIILNARFDELEDTTGLEKLENIGGDAIFNNVLTAKGLCNLKSTGGRTIFKKLKTSFGLQKLKETGSVNFESLEDASFLNNLECINGNARFPLLESAYDLSKLNTIKGFMYFPNLLSFRGFNSLKNVEGDIFVNSLEDFSYIIDIKHSTFCKITVNNKDYLYSVFLEEAKNIRKIKLK